MRWLRKQRIVYDDIHLFFNNTQLINPKTNVVADDAPQVFVSEESAPYNTGDWQVTSDGYNIYGKKKVLIYPVNIIRAGETRQ